MASVNVKTRCRSKCSILGAAAPIPENVLPTVKNVLCHVLWTEKDDENHAPDLNLVARHIEQVWKDASIPVISHQRIVSKMKESMSARKELLKIGLSRRLGSTFLAKKINFIESCDKLFDIAACKCKLYADCNCEKERKVSLS